MFGPDDLAADLPPPREDDPSSLRQDILDELADHLQCALQRERLTNTHSPESPEQRVLKRFGDPRAIARKLWFDAFQEQIMSQRLLTAMVLVLAVLCVGLTVFAWQTHVRSARSLELMEQQRVQTEEVMRHLAQLANRPEPAATGPQAPAEWNRLTVKCVYDEPGGEPAEGVTVIVWGDSDNTKAIPPMQETADATGRIDFGLVLFGRYKLRAETTDQLQCGREFSVHPGRDQELEIVCPRAGVRTEVRLVAEPGQSTADGLLLMGVLTPRPTPEREEWMTSIDEPIPFVIRPDGRICIDRTTDETATGENLEVLRKQFPDDATLTTGLTRLAGWRTRFADTVEWTETVSIRPGYYIAETYSSGVSDPADPSGQTMLSGFTVPGFDGNAVDQPVSSAPRYSERSQSVQLGKRSTVPVPLPDDWRQTDLARRLPEGMQVQGVRINFSRQVCPPVAWKSVWEEPVGLHSYELLHYRPVSTEERVETTADYTESATPDVELVEICSQIEGTGFVVERRPQGSQDPVGRLWLFLRPQERRMLQIQDDLHDLW
ncbi:MAG: hypothetical protein KDA75_21280, partial [Planctomycetaceae bacterium]|nr:hypothetical protein [Planctomycetaceae bacterium]